MSQAIYLLEVITLKRFGFFSLSLLLLLILIPGCITVQVPASDNTGKPPVIGTFSNNPSTINSGGISTLMWDVTGANTVSIDHGIGVVDGVGVKVISPNTSTVYTISATNSSGTVTRSAMTTVNSIPLPLVGTPAIITEFSSNLNSDGTSTLLWNVTGASSVSIDQNIGQVNAAGTRVVSPATATVYTISATNSTGNVTRSAVTTVNSPSPVITQFSSNLNSDGTSTLSWNVTGANSVSIDQNIGQVNVAGTRVVSTASSTVYTLSATNSSGTVTRSAVTAVNSASPVIIEFSSNLNSDGTSTLLWSVIGANWVSIDHSIGQVNAAGIRVVSPATATMYTISATNYTGTVTRSVVTTVNPGSTTTPWVQ